MLRSRVPLLLLLLSAFSVSACSDSEPDGELVVDVITEGTGTAAAAGHTLVVSYTGRFVDGTQFDSTDEAGENFVFTVGVGHVLEGWDRGLIGMKEGGTRRLTIPSHMAFGSRGQCFSDGTCSVPPNTDVIYDVTLVEIFDYVRIQDEVAGEGEIAEPGDALLVNYVGFLVGADQDGDGEDDIFDASSIHGGDFLFTLGAGSVIQGWEQGIPGMRVGGVRILTIPPSLGYGGFGSGSVPPWFTLRFRIELNDLRKPTD